MPRQIRLRSVIGVQAQPPLIVVDGPSSSGKTSLLRSFASMSPVAYRSRSLDEFVPLLPSGLFKRLSSTDEGWVEICGDFHAYLAACRASEPRMIVEMMLAWPEARDDLFRQIPREEIFYVQVYCELAELERRELGREDRRAGLARSQFDRVYAFDGYDARIDSTRISPDMCAEKLANLIQSRS